jgi:transcriptional regulator with XRE-family HTH domain
MSIGPCYLTEAGTTCAAVPPSDTRPLHRLAVVRRQQGVSRHAVASRLHISVDQVRDQECEDSDLPVSTLYAWQKVLDVPVAELLVEPDDGLPSEVLLRSQLVRLMKTVRTTLDKAKQDSVRWLVQTMINQLVEIMPELSEVGVWNIGGKQRRRSDLGVAAERRLMSDTLVEKDNDFAQVLSCVGEDR